MLLSFSPDMTSLSQELAAADCKRLCMLDQETDPPAKVYAICSSFDFKMIKKPRG